MLAEKWRCNSNEAVERLIRERIAAGELPDSTPGLEVAAFGNVVAFKIDFDRTPPMSWQQAMKISQALGRLAEGKMQGFRCAYNEDTILVFARKGDLHTISFTSPEHKKAVSVTPSILEDLSRQFRTAAMGAKANKTGQANGAQRALPQPEQAAVAHA